MVIIKNVYTISGVQYVDIKSACEKITCQGTHVQTTHRFVFLCTPAGYAGKC